MSESCLPGTAQNLLRTSGLIKHNEIAYKVGDLVVAENVIDKSRRLLEQQLVNKVLNDRGVNEKRHNKRTILKG